jgi:hypothetical protein
MPTGLSSCYCILNVQLKVLRKITLSLHAFINLLYCLCIAKLLVLRQQNFILWAQLNCVTSFVYPRYYGRRFGTTPFLVLVRISMPPCSILHIICKSLPKYLPLWLYIFFKERNLYYLADNFLFRKSQNNISAPAILRHKFRNFFAPFNYHNARTISYFAMGIFFMDIYSYKLRK